jgi:predicted methyltransferase
MRWDPRPKVRAALVITPAIQQDGCWEAAEGAWLRATVRRGNTLIDCGANIGYFSVLASQLVGARGSVIAVEPDRDTSPC